MNLPKLCIQRPVFTLVLSTLLLVFGLMYYDKLPVRQLPNIDNAVVTITTTYDGANPELVEKEITIPIENTLSGIAGIDEMVSSSQLGRSRITVTFKLDVDISDTLSDIRNKVATLASYLPEGSEAPIVNKNDSDANPAIILGFNDSKKDALQITDYLKRYVKPRIEELSGVGESYFYGERDYTIKLWLDSAKMATTGITVADIKQALKEQSIDIPSGQIKSKNRYYTVITHARLDSAKQFSNLILNDKNGYITRLSDVAKIEITSQTEDNFFRINGNPAVGLAILPQSTANPVEVAAQVKKALKEIRLTLPASMHAQVVLNSSNFIKKSVEEVYKTLLEAVLFVVIVVFAFIGNFRAALIPIVTVPICLIATFWPMQIFGFSINIITLLALVLAIGLVVDDAIVMLENIDRHIQMGKSRLQAAIQGSQEILFAIIAMTLTLAAVYAPMGFVQGFTGKLFLQFGVTLSIAVLFSGVVALTLSPMMCSKMLTTHQNAYTHWLEKTFERLTNTYKKSLTFCLKRRTVFLALLIALISSGYFVYQSLPKELAPTEDQGYIFGILNSPTNASTEYTDEYAKQLEKIYQGIDEKVTYLTSVRPSGVFSILSLQDWQQRTRNQKQISQQIAQGMQDLTGVSAFPVSPSPLGRRGGGNNSALSLMLLSNNSYQAINDLMNELVNTLQKNPLLTNIKNNLALDSSQINIDINRNLAADLQVKLSDIAELISTMLGGSNPVNFSYDGQTYPILLQLAKNERTDIAVLDRLYVKSQRDKNIPLSSLVTIKHTIGPDSLPHSSRLRSATLTAELAPGANMGQVITQIQDLLKEKLPEGYQYKFSGAAKDYLESSGSSLIAFLLALLFIYLVMAAQFESFIDPFIILLSVPLTLVGAACALLLTHGSLNIYTNIGMVTLIGLIAKHGILITEFANQMQEQGKDKLTALVEASSLRLRPILMTTAAMVLGAIPLALAFGAGAQARKQLGITIVGGMSIGTLFSLYVVPMAYSLLSRKRTKIIG